jgi:hypothetical protein
MPAERSVRTRVTLAGIATGSAAVGAVAGAPTILFQGLAVLRELRHQARIYGTKTTPSYWHELRSPKEVGWLVLLLACAGTVVLLRDRKCRPMAIGGIVFAASLFAWLGRYPFEPFRNMLPVVPLLGVAAAVAVVAVADAVGRLARLGPRTTGAVVGLLALATSAVMIGSAWRSYLDERVHIDDARVAARKWLEPRVRSGDDVLVAQELGFLPSELQRLHARADQVSLAQAVPPQTSARYDYVIVGDRPHARVWLGVLANRRPVASFGFGPTHPSPHAFREPAELVRIFAAAGTRDPSTCFPFCG